MILGAFGLGDLANVLASFSTIHDESRKMQSSQGNLPQEQMPPLSILEAGPRNTQDELVGHVGFRTADACPALSAKLLQREPMFKFQSLVCGSFVQPQLNPWKAWIQKLPSPTQA